MGYRRKKVNKEVGLPEVVEVFDTLNAKGNLVH
jgi:hypothetical protein